MQELSLNILDIAQNSLSAGATLISIETEYCLNEDCLLIRVQDNGRGMGEEQLARVTDPFFTTRVTRKVGMGLPLLKMAAEMTGGTLTVESRLGEGTCVEASFGLSHIDRLPMGDLPATMVALIGMNPDRDFVLRFRYGEEGFAADTRLYREVLGEGIGLGEPEILDFIKEQVREGITECCPIPELL